MGEAPEHLPRVRSFLSQLDAIPWFSNLGKPTEPGLRVERFYDWQAWPGPEEPAIIELSWRQQALYDAIMAEAGSEQARFASLWDQIHTVVFRVAAPRVPYDPQQDSWHGPSMAVWQAAWTAGLVGLCLYSGRPIPGELQEQWEWFVKGHWPSGYARVGAGDQLGPLLVY